MGNYAYQLLLVEPGGSGYRDVTELVQSISWTGSKNQVARELSAALAVPRDGSVEPPELDEGAALIFREGGRQRFTGQLVTATTSTQSSIVNLSALDGGRFLAGNQGWYKFTRATPEQAARTICADQGIQVGRLASTGIALGRKFPGVALDQIISTLYTMAGERNGKRYLVRFTGEGALEVLEKPGAASLEIAQTMGVTNTWDITGLCNRVAIYSENGGLLRCVEDGASQRRNGTLQRVVTQRKGKDAAAEAIAVLEDNALQQNLTVEVLSPPMELICGEAVILRDTGSGVSGLFWVDGDTHTWKNGQHLGKFKLNYRNTMNKVSAGREM